MKKTAKTFTAMLLLIFVWAYAWGEDKVLTIYFCGTSFTEDAYNAEGSAFGRPELLASVFKDYDGSTEIHNKEVIGSYMGFPYSWWVPAWNAETGANAEPALSTETDTNAESKTGYYKYIVNGAGTSWDVDLGQIDPDMGPRDWDKIKDEAINALKLVRDKYPNDDIILNLIGFSRGGVSAIDTARSASEFSWVKKINIIAFDPVPGIFDPIGYFGNRLNLSSKVNQYIGIYAEHEKSYMFEPVIPKIESNSTKVLVIRMPGGHETMVGNYQVDGGHSLHLNPIEKQAYADVVKTSCIIVEQLLTSPQWGEVPWKEDKSIEIDKNEFGTLIADIWKQDYTLIEISSFIPLTFGTFDPFYAILGRDHHLRILLLLPVLHSRLCFIGGNRHESEFLYVNNDQVYFLNNRVSRISAEIWPALQSFRGDPPPDTTPPVPNITDLPDILSECSVSITQPPAATDDTAGTVYGTTSTPLSYTEQGEYEITWTYDDGNGNTSTQTQIVIIEDLTPPDPDMDELPVINGQCSAEITEIPNAADNCTGGIDGTTTDPLSYTEQGIYTVIWSYDDGHGNITTQNQTVIVKDTEPPVINSVTADPNILWEPNHKMVPVTITVMAYDNCDSSPNSKIVSVSSSEPENYLGDGNTEFDWEITGGLTVNLRAERSGKSKEDRVYKITIECFDYAGNISTSTVDVKVPYSKKQK
ncbi:alpha/beta hydrolase fold domain-containing protein [Desulfonema limicola]|uniref:Alpha/beta hydrolase fold domain-containing protein n=1 Tax=Desulfonema limicola TaxID=45656 RepID=A0A975B348_9BACT|nr:hypothetical protein [Desulfonema limicola]QTA77917.1 alpha/beta hydrolase fold domain-containing protein [Desulfonema limicola]